MMYVECIQKGNGYTKCLPDPIVGGVYEVNRVEMLRLCPVTKSSVWYQIDNSYFRYSSGIFKEISKDEYDRKKTFSNYMTGTTTIIKEKL